ncbi:Eco57I restriction-modification methylase domain-containing protein [Rothia aeria]|uniref:Eco57I restriction-modification methylase domain-containing protein n=1 Tax=Rothia aeria TaxID=172042 RepID=UPI00244B738A|nr:N-6 DNA methylase [Rothia aeria]
MKLDSNLVNRLIAVDTPGRTEADIQSDINMLLQSAPGLLSDLGEDAPRLEEQLQDGTRRRIDIAIGATVIEIKKKLTTVEDAREPIEQLQRYVETRMQQTGSRYNGILSDGRHYWLFEQDPDSKKFVLQTTFTLASVNNIDNLISWLQAVLALPTAVVPSPDIIETTLGSSSPGYKQDKAFLEGLYREVEQNPTISLKRELWARLLRSALGQGFIDQEELFLDHTLLSIEAAAIGHAVMGINLVELAKDPRRMLSGELFRDAGIYNVIEPDFFDWILSVPDGNKFVSQIIRRINMFDWSKTEHDVLKILYESIINPEIRKGAGEYYTPDWLAEGIVEKTLTRPLSQRALDPSCGSGTFIYHIIRRIISFAEEAGWGNYKILNHIQDHVFGLDIHPVSVSLARITYLLALGMRLEDERDDIFVPVHLGDSMQWHQPAEHDESSIVINTEGVDLASASSGDPTLFSMGQLLKFPLANIEDPVTFDRLVIEMTEKAKAYTNISQKKPSFTSTLKKFGIIDPNARHTLQETFEMLCQLNAEGRDSIWGYFVRNQVRPLWLSTETLRADVLVGNPPWVAYRYMTKDMQEQFKAFSQARNLWHGARVATQQDLVSLFIARSVEKYLKEDGDFGFVTPLAVLSRSQYEGFRKGIWKKYIYSEFTEVWDLNNITPKDDLFPVPSAVIFGVKHTKSEYNVVPPHGFPEKKLVVSGKRSKEGWQKTRNNLDFELSNLISLTNEDKYCSPYRDFVRNGATIFPRFLFFVHETSGLGKLGQSRGKVQVKSMRTSLEKEPWKSISDLNGVVEKRFVYNVHLGSTIAPFKLLKPWKAVLPIDNDDIVYDLLDENSEISGIGSWWQHASDIWEMNKKKSSKLSLMENLDYQGKLSKQLGGSTYRVLYTASGNNIAAMYTDNSSVIVEHALYWIPVSGIDEARYLCAILNAPVTTDLVRDYQAIGLFGGRHFDTYPWRLNIPLFDRDNETHQELVRLSINCENLAMEVSESTLGFQKVRQKIRRILSDEGLYIQLNKVVSVVYQKTSNTDLEPYRE